MNGMNALDSLQFDNDTALDYHVDFEFCADVGALVFDGHATFALSRRGKIV